MINPFPATYSTLCPDALSELVSDRYAIGSVQCRLLVRGVGDTYLVESASEKFMLRVYRASHRNLSHIQAEVELLVALTHADVPVSYPISDLKNQTIQPIEALEGLRHAVLFSFANGKVVHQLSNTQLSSLGREMARFHQIAATIQLSGERWVYDLTSTLSIPLTRLEAAFDFDPDTFAWLRNVADEATRQLEQLDVHRFSKGYCHFDFLPKNFHFEGDAITFFDFDFMGHGWLVQDIMTFWVHLSLTVFHGRMSKQEANAAYHTMLEAYRAIRPVSEQELKAVPYLALGFWLFYMGFHTTHDQFNAFLQPGHLGFVTRYLRSVVAMYW